jgi:hypothetical protein
VGIPFSWGGAAARLTPGCDLERLWRKAQLQKAPARRAAG